MELQKCFYENSFNSKLHLQTKVGHTSFEPIKSV